MKFATKFVFAVPTYRSGGLAGFETEALEVDPLIFGSRTGINLKKLVQNILAQIDDPNMPLVDQYSTGEVLLLKKSFTRRNQNNRGLSLRHTIAPEAQNNHEMFRDFHDYYRTQNLPRARRKGRKPKLDDLFTRRVKRQILQAVADKNRQKPSKFLRKALKKRRLRFAAREQTASELFSDSDSDSEDEEPSAPAGGSRVIIRNEFYTRQHPSLSNMHCALVLLQQGCPKIVGKLTPEEKALFDDEIDMEDFQALCEKYNVAISITSPFGLVHYRRANTDTHKDRSTSMIYAVLTNRHLYPVTREVYEQITSKSYSHRRQPNTEIVDCNHFDAKIQRELAKNNRLPCFVSTRLGHITEYVKDETLYIARPNHERWQALADELLEQENDESPRQVLDAPTLARELLELYDLPKEEISDGPIRRLYDQCNLDPGFYNCLCGTCADQRRDRSVQAWDITACHWTALLNLPHLLVMSPFDSVEPWDGQPITDRCFYLLEGLPPVLHMSYNGKLLAGSLVLYMEELGISVRNYIKKFVRPRYCYKNEIFSSIQKRFDAVQGHDKEKKLVRNTITGMLGQMQAKSGIAYATTDPVEAEISSSRCVCQGDFYLTYKNAAGSFPIPHNRSIYQQIIAQSHIYLLTMAQELIQEFGGPCHVVKLKTDSVALRPGAPLEGVFNEEFFRTEMGCAEEATDAPWLREDEFFVDSTMLEQMQAFSPTPYEPISIPATRDFTYHKEAFARFPPRANMQDSICYEEPEARPSIEINDYNWDKKEHLAVLAPARMGKSYFVQGLLVDIPQEEKCVLAPTDKALSNIKGFKYRWTIQSFCTHNHIPATVKYCLLDEVSMCDHYQLSQFVNWATRNGVTMIISGDYRQLPSVNDSFNLTGSSWYHELFQPLHIDWHENCGVSLEKYQLMERFWNQDDLTILTRGTKKPRGVVPYTIAYRNETVNAAEKKQRKKLLYIVTTTCHSRGIVKGQMLVKQPHHKNFIDFKTGKRVKQATGKDVRVCHASTVHKFQGDDITTKVKGLGLHLTIDCRYMHKQMLYTALTRCPGFEFTIVNAPGRMPYDYWKRPFTMPVHYVYGYKSGPEEEGEFKYIGITNNLKQRAEAHQKAKGLPPSEMVKLMTVCSRRAALRFETRLIRKHRPPLNIQKNGDEPTRKVVPLEGRALSPPPATEKKYAYCIHSAKGEVRVKYGGKQHSKGFKRLGIEGAIQALETKLGIKIKRKPGHEPEEPDETPQVPQIPSRSDNLD